MRERVALLERAIEIADAAHEGMKRLDGTAYIYHPYRVAAKLHPDVSLMIVALLHDVVEDTSVTLEDLAAEFPRDIVGLVDALTRRKPEGETHSDYITRVIAYGKDAITVKIADVTDNLHSRGCTKSLARKFSRDLVRLNAALEEL